MNKYVIHSGNNSRLLLKPLFDRRGNWLESSEQEASEFKANFIWKPTDYPLRAYTKLEELYSKGYGVMIHNHLENHREITTKPGLVRSLRSFYQTNDAALNASYQVYDTIPTSFIITAQVEDLEFRQFLSRFEDILSGYCSKEKTPAKHCEKNMWLIKPADLNQGKGIDICWSLKEIMNILKSKSMHTLWLIQKYIERPLLFKGRKFDIRIWAIATARHDLFYYRQGYLRTSSSTYDTQATDNYIHLTNNCLQKYGDNYGAYETGNTLSFSDFQQYLNSEYPHHSLDFYRDFIPRIKDLIIDSYLSAKKKIHVGKRNKVFELFGFDFLIDEDFRVWIIEVNTNPYLGIPNNYISELLPNMLDDMLEIMVDVHLPPKVKKLRKENDFELLYCEGGSLYTSDGLGKNARRPYNTPVYPVVELAQVSMSRSRVEDDTRFSAETLRPAARDLLQTVKDELEMTVQDYSDFVTSCSRVISRLKNWQLMTEDQISAGLQAFELLAQSNISAAFVLYGHMPSIISLCVSDEIPEYIQVSVLRSVAAGCQDTKFRKEIVRLGICESLIRFNLAKDISKSIKDVAFKALLVISTHPSKNVYIPGCTREHNWVRTKVINEGVLLCLYKLEHEGEDEIKELAKVHLQNEYGLPEWEALVNILERITDTTGAASEVNDSTVKLPSVLGGIEELLGMKSSIQKFCETRREELRLKVAKEKKRKIEEQEEKSRAIEEKERVNEEKRIKAEEYIKKRYEEIKKQKIEEFQRQSNMKTQEERFDSTKKALIIEKMKKTEEIKRIQRMKLRLQEENERRSEDLRRKLLEEKRKQVMDNWLKSKSEQEAKKRLQEKLRKEEDQTRRSTEIQVRKGEFHLKLEEKKQKFQKIKEERQDSKKDSLDEENSRSMLEQEDRSSPAHSIPQVLQITPVYKDYRLLKKRQLESKKRKLILIPDKFLFEVYGSQQDKSLNNISN